ncbi:MAG: SDR family NAD(P)-dependent oxidoreductase, partial [Mariprofundaceae bacterium]|nr:SDR family NAD(P)-dependent oxidoreductase [Mariprofundaceae bacterium]
MRNILILGCGYVGERLGKACVGAGMQVFGATRSEQRASALKQAGIEPVVTDSPADIPEDILQGCDAVLDSIPLERSEGGMHAGQPHWLPELARRMSHIRWAGYLSATSVYGDADGAWVDEAWPCKPASKRGIERLKAENA